VYDASGRAIDQGVSLSDSTTGPARGARRRAGQPLVLRFTGTWTSERFVNHGVKGPCQYTA